MKRLVGQLAFGLFLIIGCIAACQPTVARCANGQPPINSYCPGYGPAPAPVRTATPAQRPFRNNYSVGVGLYDNPEDAAQLGRASFDHKAWPDLITHVVCDFQPGAYVRVTNSVQVAEAVVDVVFDQKNQCGGYISDRVLVSLDKGP